MRELGGGLTSLSTSYRPLHPAHGAIYAMIRHRVLAENGARSIRWSQAWTSISRGISGTTACNVLSEGSLCSAQAKHMRTRLCRATYCHVRFLGMIRAIQWVGYSHSRALHHQKAAAKDPGNVPDNNLRELDRLCLSYANRQACHGA